MGHLTLPCAQPAVTHTVALKSPTTNHVPQPLPRLLHKAIAPSCKSPSKPSNTTATLFPLYPSPTLALQSIPPSTAHPPSIHSPRVLYLQTLYRILSGVGIHPHQNASLQRTSTVGSLFQEPAAPSLPFQRPALASHTGLGLLSLSRPAVPHHQSYLTLLDS